MYKRQVLDALLGRDLMVFVLDVLASPWDAIFSGKNSVAEVPYALFCLSTGVIWETSAALFLPLEMTSDGEA